jgi:hypothetical protein
MNEQLDLLWNDPEVGFTSLAQFSKNIKEKGVKITQKNLKEWFDSLSENQITKPVTRDPKAFIPIQCPPKVECLQADLMDISKYSRTNGGVKFLFNILHLDTRFVWSFPIKSKSPTNIVDHLASVVDLVKKRAPQNEVTLTTDDGSEFKASVGTFLKKNNIKHYTSVDSNNTANIERFHRTLWGYINKYATAKNTLKFIDVLPQLISKYNKATNRSIRGSPLSKWNLSEFKPNYRLPPVSNFNVGDRVRFMVKLKTFDKRSFNNKFSTNTFLILSKEGNRFQLSNGNSYLARELVMSNDKSEKDGVDKKIKEVTKVNRTIRKNRQDFAGFDVKSIDETGVVFKEKSRPVSEKRVIRKPARFIGNGIVFY